MYVCVCVLAPGRPRGERALQVCIDINAFISSDSLFERFVHTIPPHSPYTQSNRSSPPSASDENGLKLQDKNLQNENILQEVGQLLQYPAKVSQTAGSFLSVEQASPLPTIDNANASPLVANCNTDNGD
jgi:hypothetical protein